MAYRDRLQGRLDRRHIVQATVAVVGCGSVGGQVAWELARLGPGRLILVDGDDLEPENRVRHVLPAEYEGMSKAVALADWITREIPGVREVTAHPTHVTEAVSDERLTREVLGPAHLVVVATDNLAVQRRVALAARLADVPAIVPGVAPDGSRGEVFLSLGWRSPCIECFDGYRAAGDPVRGASMSATDLYPTVQASVDLAIALLDQHSEEARRLLPPLRAGGPTPQLFRVWRAGAPELQAADDGRTEVAWRRNCPGCGSRATAPIADPPGLRELLEGLRAWLGLGVVRSAASIYVLLIVLIALARG